MPSADNNRLYKGPLNDLLDDDFDQALKDVMQAWDIPGVSIALVREADGGSEELIRCYGLRNRADPVTEDTTFAIASNSKLFTALAVGRALQSSGYSYDTRVRDILPEFGLQDELASRECTVADTLSHRTGLPGYHAIWTEHFSDMPFLERLKLLPPTLSFRSKFQYCNPAYEVAPLIIERLTGMPFTDYVSREFLEPLGMGHTSHKSSQATALGYVPKLTPEGVKVGEGWDVNVALDRTGTMSGCAGMISSAKDMVKWLKALPSIPEYQLTIVPRVISSPNFLPSSSFYDSRSTYGLGVHQSTYRGTPIYEHTGEAAGFRGSAVRRFPTLGVGLAVMCNSNEGVEVTGWVEMVLLDKLLGLEPSDWKRKFDETRRQRHAPRIKDYPSISGNPDLTPPACLFGTWTSPGLLTMTLGPSNILPTRPECVQLPWLPWLYGSTRPVLTCIEQNKFVGCQEWISSQDGVVRYGDPFKAELAEGGLELRIYGWSIQSPEVPERDCPITLRKVGE